MILPALAGGYSTLLGWPQAALIFTAVLALMLTDPAAVRRLPWWYWVLGAGLVLMAIIWLWPGDALVVLSPTRRNWPGPSGAVSGIAADRVGTTESLLQALGFFALLGISLLVSDRPAYRRRLMRWMVACCGLVFGAAILIHFLHLPVILLPDVAVLTWTRLSYPFTGPNLSAAFFVSSVPFGAGMWLVHSAEGRFLPIRRVWQLIGTVLVLTMLALQLLTQNRWMWFTLVPFVLGGLTWYLLRKRSRRRRLRALFLVLAAILVVALFLSLFDPGAVVQRFVLLVENDQNTNTRPQVWQNAWNTFREYPLVGVGLGGFGEVCPTTAPPEIYLWPRYAHCEPLEWLAETGIVGMALLGVVIFGMIQTAWRQIRARMPWQERMPFAAAALLLGMACMVDFPLRCPALLFLFAMYLGITLGADRSAAEIDAENGLLNATGGEAGTTAVRPPAEATLRRRWLAMGLVGLLLIAGGLFLPFAVKLFGRGLALADYEAQRRQYEIDHDRTAVASAATTLFQAAGGQPRWSAEALNTILATAERDDSIDTWSTAVADILEDSPYHDSLYYFRARVALDAQDYELAARMNARARECAATNRSTLRKIAGLDWVLAAVAIDPAQRAARLAHAQETTRWLLMGNPELLWPMADGCHQLQIPLDDFLPGIPLDWKEPSAFCRVCLDHDRPLTALQVITAGDLYMKAAQAARESESRTPLMTRWDLQVLTTTGQADAIEERMTRLYHEAAANNRPGVVANVRVLGWGVLTPDQFETFIKLVEDSLPSALERYELGLLYIKLGQEDQARQCWLASFKGHPTPQVAAALAQYYANAAAYSPAIEYATEWTQLDSNNPTAWRYLAQLGVLTKDFATAKLAFNRYQALAPDQAESDYVMHGIILRGTGAAPPKPSPDR